MSESEPKIPRLIATVHTSELPVEVETDYEIRVWLDEYSQWSDEMPQPDAGPDIPQVLRTEGSVVVDDGVMPPTTIRICELLPVDELDDPDFTPTTPGEGVDWQAEWLLAKATAADLDGREELNRHEREKLERMRRRVELLGGDDD